MFRRVCRRTGKSRRKSVRQSAQKRAAARNKSRKLFLMSVTGKKKVFCLIPDSSRMRRHRSQFLAGKKKYPRNLLRI